MSTIHPNQILAEIRKGTFVPHTALSNIAMAYFQDSKNYFAKAIFPICPVPLPSDIYYRFAKEDLLRDNWQRKPAYGKVMPGVLSEDTDTYLCMVDQAIFGIDQIRQTVQQRRQGPALKDPRKQKARAMAEQANIHLDRMFAEKYFKTGVWGNELTGIDDVNPTSDQFIKFSNANSDPIDFFAKLKKKIHEQTGRTPNKAAFGANVLDALTVHPGILERVKYGGTTANPANVTENVLAQLFGLDEIVVMNSIQNKAKPGAEADMGYIGDPNAFLLAYTTDAPSVDEPSAGYTFAWDMLGDGNLMPILNYEGERGTHSEFIEGLMAYDMRKTGDDLAVFCKEVV